MSSKKLKPGQGKLEISGRTKTIQITALLRSVKILRRTLETQRDLTKLQ